MSDSAEKRSPCADTGTAAYWRGRAEMAEAQAITGEPVPIAVADLIHERDDLTRENERLRAVMQGILDDADERYYTLRNDEWFLVRLRNTLARFGGYPATTD